MEEQWGEQGAGRVAETGQHLRPSASGSEDDAPVQLTHEDLLPQGELRTVVDRLVRVVYDQGLQIQALQRTAQEAARADDVAQLRDSLGAEVAAVRSDLRAEVGDVEQRVDTEFRRLRDVAFAPRRGSTPQAPRSARPADDGGKGARTARAAAQRAEEAISRADAVQQELREALAALHPADQGPGAGALDELREQVSAAALQADQALAVAEEAEDRSSAAVADALSDVHRSIADSADQVRAEARMAASHAASLDSRLAAAERGMDDASEACQQRTAEVEERLLEAVARAERGVVEAREEAAREAAALQERMAAVEERAMGAVTERVERATRAGDAQWEALRDRVSAVEEAAQSAREDAGRAAERGAEAVEAASELESAQSGLLGRVQILEHDMAAARGETASLQQGAAAVEERAKATVDRVEHKLANLVLRVSTAEGAIGRAAGREEVEEGVARLDAEREALARKLEEEAAQRRRSVDEAKAGAQRQLEVAQETWRRSLESRLLEGWQSAAADAASGREAMEGRMTEAADRLWDRLQSVERAVSELSKRDEASAEELGGRVDALDTALESTYATKSMVERESANASRALEGKASLILARMDRETGKLQRGISAVSGQLAGRAMRPELARLEGHVEQWESRFVRRDAIAPVLKAADAASAVKDRVTDLEARINAAFGTMENLRGTIKAKSDKSELCEAVRDAVALEAEKLEEARQETHRTDVATLASRVRRDATEWLTPAVEEQERIRRQVELLAQSVEVLQGEVDSAVGEAAQQAAAVAPEGESSAASPAGADKRRRAQTAGGAVSTTYTRIPYRALPPTTPATPPAPARTLGLTPPRVSAVPVAQGRPLVSPASALPPSGDGARAQQAESGREGGGVSARRARTGEWLVTVNGRAIAQLLARVRELGYSGHSYPATRARGPASPAGPGQGAAGGDAELRAAVAESDAVNDEAERTIRHLSSHYGRDATGRITGGGEAREQLPARDAQRASSAVQRTLSRVARPAPNAATSSSDEEGRTVTTRAAAELVRAFQDSAPRGWHVSEGGPSSGEEGFGAEEDVPICAQASTLPRLGATPHEADIYDSFTGPGRRFRALVSPRPTTQPRRPRAGQQRPPRKTTPGRRSVKTERGRAEKSQEERPEVGTPSGWRSASPSREGRHASGSGGHE